MTTHNFFSTVGTGCIVLAATALPLASMRLSTDYYNSTSSTQFLENPQWLINTISISLNIFGTISAFAARDAAESLRGTILEKPSWVLEKCAFAFSCMSSYRSLNIFLRSVDILPFSSYKISECLFLASNLASGITSGFMNSLDVLSRLSSEG